MKNDFIEPSIPIPQQLYIKPEEEIPFLKKAEKYLNSLARTRMYYKNKWYIFSKKEALYWEALGICKDEELGTVVAKMY